MVIDMQPFWINNIRMKEFGTNQKLGNQIVSTSEIDLSEPNLSLYIHVIIDNVIVINCQSHNYLNCIPLSAMLPDTFRSIGMNTKMFKTTMHVSSRKCQSLADNVYFIKDGDAMIRVQGSFNQYITASIYNFV